MTDQQRPVSDAAKWAATEIHVQAFNSKIPLHFEPIIQQAIDEATKPLKAENQAYKDLILEALDRLDEIIADKVSDHETLREMLGKFEDILKQTVFQEDDDLEYAKDAQIERLKASNTAKLERIKECLEWLRDNCKVQCPEGHNFYNWLGNIGLWVPGLCEKETTENA